MKFNIFYKRTSGFVDNMIIIGDTEEEVKAKIEERLGELNLNVRDHYESLERLE